MKSRRAITRSRIIGAIQGDDSRNSSCGGCHVPQRTGIEIPSWVIRVIADQGLVLAGPPLRGS